MAPRRRPAAVLARERAAAEVVQREVVVVGRQQRGEIVGLPGGRVALQDRRDLHALVVLRAGGGRDGRDRCERSQELAARDRRVPDVTVRAAAAAALSETGYGHLAEARKRRKSSLSTLRRPEDGAGCWPETARPGDARGRPAAAGGRAPPRTGRAPRRTGPARRCDAGSSRRPGPGRGRAHPRRRASRRLLDFPSILRQGVAEEAAMDHGGRRDFLKGMTAMGASIAVGRRPDPAAAGAAPERPAKKMSYDPAGKFELKVSEVEFLRTPKGRQLMARVYQPQGPG